MNIIKQTDTYRHWVHWAIKQEDDCQHCTQNRHWFLARDNEDSRFQQSMRTTWLCQEFTWGPMHWPTTWCTIFQDNTLDCAAFAELSLLGIQNRGGSGQLCQLIQKSNRQRAAHWTQRWNKTTSAHWISDEFVYHEVVALPGLEGTLQFWDPTKNYFLEDEDALRTIGAVAYRILDREEKGCIYSTNAFTPLL